jgi:hypothetical protein
MTARFSRAVTERPSGSLAKRHFCAESLIAHTLRSTERVHPSSRVAIFAKIVSLTVVLIAWPISVG